MEELIISKYLHNNVNAFGIKTLRQLVVMNISPRHGEDTRQGLHVAVSKPHVGGPAMAVPPGWKDLS